jgi:hypothetical protein
MISALEIRKQLAFALDAEDSDHYRDDVDYIPAINASIKWLTAVINSALGQNKIGEEFFRDIAYSGVFQTDEDSRVSLKVFPNEVWSILAIYIKPSTKSNGTKPAFNDLKRSYFRSDLYFIESGLDCKRLTIEEWARNKLNPFEPGYDGDNLCDALKRYSYLNPFNHRNSNTDVLHSEEIEVRPKVENDLITVFWVKKPQPIATINDDIEFPDSCFQLIFEKALNYISYKQGDQTNIYTVSSRDINELLNMI